MSGTNKLVQSLIATGKNSPSALISALDNANNVAIANDKKKKK